MKAAPYLLSLPALLLFGVVVIVPLGATVAIILLAVLASVVILANRWVERRYAQVFG